MFGLALPGWAAEQTDIGSADKAQLEKVHPSKPAYSPYAGRTFPTLPLFGDTHLHTSYSLDAGAFGARLSPREPTASLAARKSRRTPASR